MKTALSVILLYLLCSACGAWGGQNNGRLKLGSDYPYSVFVDSSGKRTIEEIAQLPADNFRPVSGGLSLGYTGKTAWLRFDTPPADWPGNEWWLELSPPFLDSIQLYEPTASGWLMRQTGDHFKYSLREFKHRFFLFHLQAKPSLPPKTVYLRIKTTSSLYLVATLWSPDTFSHNSSSSMLLWGLYFGFLLIALAFMFIMVALNRSRRFLVLAIGTLINALLLVITQGLVVATPVGEYPLWADASVGIFTLLSIASAIWGMREFVICDAKMRWLDRCYLAAVWICTLAPISIIFNVYGMAVRIALLLNLLAVVGTMIVLFINKHQSSTYKRIMLCAMGLYIVSYMTTFLQLNGVIPVMDMSILLRNSELLTYTLLGCTVLLNEIRQTYKRQVSEKELELERSQEAERLLDLRVIERTAELTEAQESLQTSLHNERQMLLEQRQFLSMVSHEFRTPLAVIDAAATNLQALKTLDIKNQHHRLDKIRRATRSLGTLIDNCMTSERIELGGFTVMRQDTPLAPLVLETAQLVSFSPQHTFAIECANADLSWNLDPMLIKIALSNLIDNAVKYSDGGTVTLNVQTQANELCFAVINKGHGIQADEARRLFQKFVRGSAANRGKGIRGSGLGLFISQRIAQAHGGDVRLVTEREGVTIFELRIGV